MPGVLCKRNSEAFKILRAFSGWFLYAFFGAAENFRPGGGAWGGPSGRLSVCALRAQTLNFGSAAALPKSTRRPRPEIPPPSKGFVLIKYNLTQCGFAYKDASAEMAGPCSIPSPDRPTPVKQVFWGRNFRLDIGRLFLFAIQNTAGRSNDCVF